MGTVILFSALGLTALGLFFGIALAVASKVFAVKRDPKVEAVLDALPGVNCGTCGYPGCRGFAEALVRGEVDVTLCAAGGPRARTVVPALLGVESGEVENVRAVIRCKGGTTAKKRFEYSGIADCNAAFLVGGGESACLWGCLGYYSCARACRFGAILPDEGGTLWVDPSRCVGCRACVSVCPKGLIEMVPEKKRVHVLCLNRDRGKAVTSVCEVGCIGCTRCVPACPEKVRATYMEEGLGRIDYEKCVSCGLCAEACPVGVILDTRPKKTPTPASA